MADEPPPPPPAGAGGAGAGGPDPRFPRLVEAGGGALEIHLGGRRAPVPAAFAARVRFWHGHLAGHGEAEARIYLLGVLDGLGAAAAESLQTLLAEMRERRARARAELDALRRDGPGDAP